MGFRLNPGAGWRILAALSIFSEGEEIMLLPAGSKIVGPCVHPVDGAAGTAIAFAVGPREWFWDGCALRGLPRDWRKHQPPADRPARVTTPG